MFFSTFKRVSGLVLIATTALTISACQSQTDKIIDNYFERKGPEAVEKAIDAIVKKKREEARRENEPSMEERLKKRYDVKTEGAAVKGDENAPITIVTFSDFECPFCKRVLPTIEKVMADYKGKVKLYFRHNPLPFHQRAMPAAKAAVAAQRQGKFWEMHDKLFQSQDNLSDENLKKIAKELGLNMSKFEKDMKDPAVETAIKADSEFARGNEAGGTPAFFLNGVLLVGAQPYEAFKDVIEALLKEKK